MASSNPYAEFRSGWPTLMSVTVGSAVGVTALLFYSLGSFSGPLNAEFGWTRAQITASFLYTTIALTLMAAPLGWLLDRFGPRRIALVSVPGLTLSLVLLSQFQGDLLAFQLLFGLAGLLGAGTTSVVYTKALNSVFFRKRGMALGISLAGLGAAALVLPLLVMSVVQPLGWRAGFLTLAGLSLVAMPFVFFGISHLQASDSGSEASSGTTRREALTSRTFWTILIGFILVGGSVPAIIPHMVPMLTDESLTPVAAAGIAGLIGVGVIIGRLCIGALVDRFYAPYIAAPLFLLTALGCLLLMWGGPAIAPLAALLVGLSFGAEADLIAFFCGNYFGLRSYGFIYGLIYAAFSLAISIGPIWAGGFFDRTGSYDGALITVAVMLAAGAAVLLTLPRQQPYARPARTDERLAREDAGSIA